MKRQLFPVLDLELELEEVVELELEEVVLKAVRAEARWEHFFYFEKKTLLVLDGKINQY